MNTHRIMIIYEKKGKIHGKKLIDYSVSINKKPGKYKESSMKITKSFVIRK